MSLSITQRPFALRPDSGSGDITCRWNAVGNPIIYKFTSSNIAHDGFAVEVEVYNSANTLLNDDPLRFMPNTSGVTTANISSILKAYLLADHDVSGTVDEDSNVYLKFYIKVREVWTGSAEAQANDTAYQFFAVLASLQIPSAYGGNMALYSAFDGIDVLPKFLTKLDSPVMWRDYPFFLSIIVQEDMNELTEFYAFGVTFTDVLGAAANHSDTILAVNLADAAVEAEDTFSIYLRDDSNNAPVSETLTVTVRDACANPIMLMARNKLGGVIQWMFDGGQEIEYDFNKVTKSKRMVLSTENLSYNEWLALQDFISLGDIYRNNIVEFSSTTIKTSSRIGQQVYMVDSDGTKTGVIVIPTKNTTLTRANAHRFEIEIELPEEF